MQAREVIDTVSKACAYGAYDKLQEFVAADPGCVNAPDESGYFPLQWAALNNRMAEANYLLAQGASVNATDHTGQTALHWAAVRGSLPVIETLLRNHADCELKDNKGYTVAHVAAQYGQTAVLYHLALRWNVNIDLPDTDGRTPLHWAAYKGYSDTIRLLLVLDASYQVADKEGCTALHWAAIKGNGEACTVLLQDGSAFLTVYGSSGDSGEQALSNDSAAMFDRASTDVFTFNCKDLGDIKKLVLRLADSSGGGVHSQWHVASVDVLHKRSGWCTPFTFDEWLQVDSSATRDKPQAARNVYQPHTITVTTADTEDASFSGDVSLVLRGTSGATTYGIPLTSAGRGGKSPFAAGSKAEFRVRAADVWPLESATVSMVTGPNSGSSWRPLKLEVRNDESGATATFGNDSTLLFYWDGAQELKLLPGDGNVSSGADEDEKRREEERRREEEERKARELEEEERKKREQEEEEERKRKEEEELKKQQEQEEEERKRKEEEERKRKEEEDKLKAASGGGDPTPPTSTPTPPGVRTNDNFTDTETDMGDSATDMFDSVSIRSGSVLRG